MKENLKKLVNQFKITLFHITPLHFISNITYKVSRIEDVGIKNLLIKIYIAIFDIKLDEYKIKDIKEFKSLNDFFTRDLDLSFRKNLDESNKIDSLLFDYLRKNISLKANTELKKIEFVGKEIGLNETFIYFQIPNIYMPSVIEVNSSFLLDLLDDQSNVFHFDCNGSIKSLFTRAYKTIDTAHLDCN